MTIDRAAFWEFKARVGALDLDVVRLRTQLAAVTARRNALVDAFAAAHGLDARKPLVLEDTDCTVSQEA